jgi:Gene product 88
MHTLVMPDTAQEIAEMTISSNTKTGYSLNLPAIKSCPGSTRACRSICYANRGRYLMNGALTTDHNWAIVQADPTAVERIKWPLSKSVKAHRLMSSGDIFSVEFGRSLLRMCDKNPHLIFWGYTRSLGILRALLNERPLPPNLTLFISVDKDNKQYALAMCKEFGLPPAYLGDDVADGKQFICPAIAKPDKYPLSRKKSETPCQRCTYCFSDKVAAHRAEIGVTFPEH